LPNQEGSTVAKSEVAEEPARRPERAQVAGGLDYEVHRSAQDRAINGGSADRGQEGPHQPKEDGAAAGSLNTAKCKTLPARRQSPSGPDLSSTSCAVVVRPATPITSAEPLSEPAPYSARKLRRGAGVPRSPELRNRNSTDARRCRSVRMNSTLGWPVRFAPVKFACTSRGCLQ
jgi:hypothetical protein